MTSTVDLERAEEIVGYRFTKRNFLVEALTAADRIDLENGEYQRFENNKRSAALGDIVIKLIITEDWLSADQDLSKASILYGIVAH